MFFLAADAELATLRYRNRAIQYLYGEAGMALQNGALAASHLDLGFVVFGSYYESVVRTLCGIPDHLILGAAIFGLPPTAAQQASATEAPAVDFAWAEAPSAEYTLPFFVGRAKQSTARPIGRRGAEIPIPPWHTARPSPKPSNDRAIANPVTCARQPGRNCQARSTRARSRGSVRNSIGARTSLACHSMSPRHSTGPKPNASPMANASRCWLTWCTRRTPCATSMDKQRSIGAATLPAARQARPWPTRRLPGTLELIERDAFMRHWFAQQPGVGLAIESLPGEFQTRVQAICHTGFTVSVQTLTASHGQVAFFFARHAERQFSCVSAGAGLTLARAMESALVELESRVFSLLNGHDVGQMRPSNVVTPDDHFALYARPAWFNRADNLATPAMHTSFSQAEQRDLTSPQALYDALVAAGIVPLFVDITPRQNALGNGERLSVARAFAPGLIPMAFGNGMVPRQPLQSPPRVGVPPSLSLIIPSWSSPMHLPPGIEIHDDWFAPDLLDRLIQATNWMPMYFLNRASRYDTHNLDIHWYYPIAITEESLFGRVEEQLDALESPLDVLREAWEQIATHIGGDLGLYECSVSANTFGTEGNPHFDFRNRIVAPAHLTVLVYCSPQWDITWAGETLIFDEQGRSAAASCRVQGASPFCVAIRTTWADPCRASARATAACWCSSSGTRRYCALSSNAPTSRHPSPDNRQRGLKPKEGPPRPAGPRRIRIPACDDRHSGGSSDGCSFPTARPDLPRRSPRPM
ncbi:YcaO-like family protein [Achromobacter insuavis]